MAFINGNQVLFSPHIHEGYERGKAEGYESGYNYGFEDGQISMIDESKIVEKTASGAFISVDDVSEIPHKVGGKVESVNLISAFLDPSAGTANGITYTPNEDGTITANGTATADSTYVFSKLLLFGTYTLSGCPVGGSKATYFLGLGDSGSADVGSGATRSDNIESARNLFIRIVAGTTVENLIFKPMLNYGTAVLPYTPYVSPETVQVTRCGKNLLDIEKSEGISNTIEILGDSIIIKAQEKMWGVKFYELVKAVEVGHTYTLSAESVTAHHTLSDGWGWRVRNIDGNWSVASGSLSYTFTVTKPITLISFYAGMPYEGNQDIVITKPQMNEGTTALPYEPYNGQTLTPNTDGTVEGMTSLSPYMNIFTNNAGATLEATYRMSWGMQEERERFYNDFQQGKINVSISFEWLALDKASTKSIINALSNTATGQTLTLNIAAVNTAFETSSAAKDGSTSTEFAALVATKTNWTIVLK